MKWRQQWCGEFLWPCWKGGPRDSWLQAAGSPCSAWVLGQIQGLGIMVGSFGLFSVPMHHDADDTEVFWNPTLHLSLHLVGFSPLMLSSFLFLFLLCLPNLRTFCFFILKTYTFSYYFRFLVQFLFLSAFVLEPWSNLPDYFKCFISWVLVLYLNLFYS